MKFKMGDEATYYEYILGKHLVFQIRDVITYSLSYHYPPVGVCDPLMGLATLHVKPVTQQDKTHITVLYGHGNISRTFDSLEMAQEEIKKLTGDKFTHLEMKIKHFTAIEDVEIKS